MTTLTSFSWERVELLTDRAPRWADLELHRLDLVGARRRRALGQPLPEAALEAERLARIRAVAALHLLQRVRDAYGGMIVLFKGLEAAAAYPDPLLRSFVDLDLLVDDVGAAQKDLLAAGFQPSPDPPWLSRRSGGEALYDLQQHARPLHLPDIPLKVELHRRPSWPAWLEQPTAEPFLAAAVPGTSGVEDVLALPPAHHALVLAAHAWVDEPLARLRDLVDVCLVARAADPNELDHLAHAFGLSRLWSSTLGSAVALFGHDNRSTFALKTFARNLPEARERTVAESHLARTLGPFCSLPPRAAVRQSVANLAWTFRPAAEEPWSRKLKRMLRAVAHADRPKSTHDAMLAADARQFHPPKRWRRH